MKFFKSLKKTMLIISVTYIAIGVLMIIDKETCNKLAFEILAYGLTIGGILSMIRYFMIDIKNRIKRNDFVIGSLLVSIAAVIYLTRADVAYLMGKIIALAMIFSGFHKIQDLFDVKAANGKNVTGIYLFGFFVCVSIGLLVLFDVIKNTNALYVIGGLGMCVCGISDIVSNFYFAFIYGGYDSKEKKETYNIQVDETEVKADSVSVDDEQKLD